jgi:hypothetical protein
MHHPSRNWRLIVADIPIHRPFRAPIYVPKVLWDAFSTSVATLRLCQLSQPDHGSSRFVRVGLPVNYVTALLMAIVLLLATSAIGWQEVSSGVLGNEDTGITPYDVVLVFLTLGYVANSIAASGLVRYLVSLVLNGANKKGHVLF